MFEEAETTRSCFLLSEDQLRLGGVNREHEYPADLLFSTAFYIHRPGYLV